MKRPPLRSLLGLLAGMAAALAASAAHADRLDTIRLRGALQVGVKTDYPPFGAVDANGNIIGFEADLAAEVARRLGVGLTMVGVTASNRLQKLEDGSIDLLIATMADTQQRREIATLIEPDYYASGVTLMARRDSRIDNWNEVRGKKVCATQGGYYNRPMAVRYLLDLQIFTGTRDATLALREGRCIGWLYDDTAIANDLRQPEWRDYGAPLPSAMVVRWAMAIARSERNSKFETLLSDIVADWHRSAWLQDEERRWAMKPIPFLDEMHELWSRKNAAGDYVCTRRTDGAWPAACRNQQVLTAREAEGIERLGLEIKEAFGLDLTLIYDAYDRGLFLRGLGVTLLLALTCVAGSLALGVLGWRLATVRYLGGVVRGLAQVIPMTPPLMQIYLVFFGIGGLLASRFDWSFGGFPVVSACLSAYTGAAIARALIEADTAVTATDGSTQQRSLRRVLRLAYASVVASLVNVVKATGMASVVAVPELIQASTTILAERGNAGVMMNALMVTYFLLVTAVVRVFAVIERKVFDHDDR